VVHEGDAASEEPEAEVEEDVFAPTKVSES
jgi:hypothetical protein